MSEHTPGPWSVIAATSQEDFDGFWINKQGVNPSRGRRSIADAHGPQSSAEAQANANANALLIAAAPDLLAACKQVLGGMDIELGSSAVDVNFPLLRAAIAKATGEQNG